MTNQKQQHTNIAKTYSNKVKILVAILVLLFVFSNTTKAQDVSCSELVTYVKKEGGYPSSQSCFGSSWLVKVDRYEIDGNGVVIAYIKSNEFDFSGKPYIYCGISYSTWSSFTSEGMMGSWGKAFHKYIKGNNCSCY